MKVFEKIEPLLHQLITSPLRGSEWSFSCQAILLLRKVPYFPVVVDWVDPRAGWYTMQNEKLPPC
jgi:hypothetical protein